MSGGGVGTRQQQPAKGLHASPRPGVPSPFLPGPPAGRALACRPRCTECNTGLLAPVPAAAAASSTRRRPHACLGWHCMHLRIRKPPAIQPAPPTPLPLGLRLGDAPARQTALLRRDLRHGLSRTVAVRQAQSPPPRAPCRVARWPPANRCCRRCLRCRPLRTTLPLAAGRGGGGGSGSPTNAHKQPSPGADGSHRPPAGKTRRHCRGRCCQLQRAAVPAESPRNARPPRAGRSRSAKAHGTPAVPRVRLGRVRWVHGADVSESHEGPHF